MIQDAPPCVPLVQLASAAGIPPRDLRRMFAETPSDMPAFFSASGTTYVDLEEARLWLSDLAKDRRRRKLRPSRAI